MVTLMAQAVRLDRSLLQEEVSAAAVLGRPPLGPSFGAQLATAVRSALVAEQAYAAWLVDLQGTGCYSAPTNDLHYEQAKAASAASRRAWQRLSSSWAPVARTYGLARWQPIQI